MWGLSESSDEFDAHHTMKTTLFAALLTLSCTTAHGQDPVTTSPKFYKVLLENDQVRVLEYRLKPGEKEPMHSHPAGVVYVLSGAKVKFTTPDGRSEERPATSGETFGGSRLHTPWRTSALRKLMPSRLT